MLPEKVYGTVCFSREKYLTPSGKTFHEIAADKLSQGAGQDCDDFIIKFYGSHGFIKVAEARFKEFLYELNELTGSKSSQPSDCIVRIPEKEADIDEVPVAQLPCPVEKHSFLKSLNNKFQQFKLRIKT